jgi:hypothetical protein
MNEREAIKVGSWSPRNIAGGYWGTTTLAVCRRPKVSHGSLLHHFGTREKRTDADAGDVARVPRCDAVRAKIASYVPAGSIH